MSLALPSSFDRREMSAAMAAAVAARMSASTVAPAVPRMIDPMQKTGSRAMSAAETPMLSASTNTMNCRPSPGISQSWPSDSPMPRARGGETSEIDASRAGKITAVVNSASIMKATVSHSHGDSATPT